MTDLHTASALGTLMGHIQQIRISYEYRNPDLGARLERLFAEAERIERRALMNEDANERYDCLRCETSMAPEELRARVVTATYYEPAYTEYVCPWCGGEVESNEMEME